MTELTPEQRRAVERRDGSLLVRAGAGTGKTAVLVERFVQAVLEDGVAVATLWLWLYDLGHRRLLSRIAAEHPGARLTG